VILREAPHFGNSIRREWGRKNGRSPRKEVIDEARRRRKRR
jgi:hypothetical protein